MMLLVYGTLKYGGSNSDLLKGAYYMGPRKVRGYDMHSIVGKFPGIVPGEGTVSGEVYIIDEEKQLPAIDALEDAGFLYYRDQVETTSGERVWTYIFNQPVDHYPKIPDGVWKV